MWTSGFLGSVTQHSFPDRESWIGELTRQDNLVHRYLHSSARRSKLDSVQNKVHIAKGYADKAGALLYWLRFGTPTGLDRDVAKAREHISSHLLPTEWGKGSL